MNNLNSVADRVRTASEVAVLREPAFKVIARLQHVNPSDQIRALMLAAAVVCEACRLDPHEEIARALRMISDAEGPYTHHIQALREYAEGELRR